MSRDRADPRMSAEAVAAACGVTRLAEVTRLDRIGVPVVQAVRPLGRSLSVHQGKALTLEGARLGAAMEAAECDHAERFVADQRDSCFDALPFAARPPTLSDFAAGAGPPPADDEPLRWVRARGLTGAPTLWIPSDVVSLDLSRPGDDRLDRSSSGLGARFDLDGAILKGVLELIERDAEQAWLEKPPSRRARDRLELASVDAPSFRDLEARIRKAGLSLAVYRLAAVIPLPVFYAEIDEPGTAFAPGRRVNGSACALVAQDALIGAVIEAAQARLTAISGARDDILPTAPSPARPPNLGVASPLPAHLRPLRWDGVVAGYPAVGGVADIGRRLFAAGYPDIAVVDLSRQGSAIKVVKVVVPGLGGSGRSRRVSGAPL